MATNKCCTPEPTQEDLTRRLSIEQLLTMQNELNVFCNPSWMSSYSVDHYKTGIYSNSGEFLNNHNLVWQFCGDVPTDPFNQFEADLEIVDMTQYFLSMMIIFINEGLNGFDLCEDKTFEQFEFFYAGSDKGNTFGGIGIYCSVGALNHHNFVSMMSKMTCQTYEDIFQFIDGFDYVTSAAGFTSSYYAAMYMGKYAIVEGGEANPAWTFITDTSTNEERLKPLVDAFMNTPSMTLDQLKQNVYDEFYVQV